jgi:probable rRNA maturation factor
MILNKQTKVRLAKRPLREFLRKAQRELQIAGAEVTVAFVSDAEIARWNELYRHKKGPTDVLSFPAVTGAKTAATTVQSSAAPKLLGDIAIAPKTRSAIASEHLADVSIVPKLLGDIASKSKILGDIAIAPETAKRYARKNGRTLNQELRVLILHGLLHLMGYDHERDAGQMNRIEKRLRRRLGVV